MMCADLVDVEWHDERGKRKTTVANLEDISAAGVCLQLEDELPLRVTVDVKVGKTEYRGVVRYCVYRDFGYFAGIEFGPGTKWNARAFKPMHLFDPRRLSS
ncbi:MAG: hypothetical protein FJW30_09915 [Acidobacteria bacterium]|nr:hypothetical protein [Acidobacteriota bacterium]